MMLQGPGFGKTTAIAAATIGMSLAIGKTYCTAPTHVAVNNFAGRLVEVANRVTDRCNLGRSTANQVRRPLIVRGHKPKDELRAFMHLLESPGELDAIPSSTFSPPSRWQLPLSMAFWLLVALRARAVEGMCPDVPTAIEEMRKRLDGRSELAALRAVATGHIDWPTYQQGAGLAKNDLPMLMGPIAFAADALCTTPALSSQQPYCTFRDTIAKAVAVDEAGSISRPDLYTVWGNTLSPCLLGGDEKQLSPALMTSKEKDGSGNYINRHAPDGKISPLLFFKSTGWPVYRLRVQLRMAKDLFAVCHKEVYSDLPAIYGPGGDINLPHHAIGLKFEAFLRARFNGLAAPPAGTLMPAFIHCEGSFCFKDPTTLSKKNPDQVKIALDLVKDFVTATAVDAGRIVVMSPYKAMVEHIARQRKRPEYATALAKMPEAATADSFQGQEGDIVVVIFGTTVRVGPGFTLDEQRLNVMLSRQRCGLLLVGDVNVAGSMTKEKGAKKGKNKGRNDTVKIIGEEGKVAYVAGGMLYSVHKALWESGRVATVSVEPKKK